MVSGRCRGQGNCLRVYDLGASAGFVSVGVDHDTPVFAVATIKCYRARLMTDSGSFRGGLVEVKHHAFTALRAAQASDWLR